MPSASSASPSTALVSAFGHVYPAGFVPVLIRELEHSPRRLLVGRGEALTRDT